MVVVIAPGPTSSGIAIGTAPKLSGDSPGACELLPETSILTAMISRRMPPAISKAKIESPKIVSTSWPRNAKNSSRTNPTSDATLKTFRRWAGSIFSVKPMKMGMLPNGSTIMNSAIVAGIRAERNSDVKTT